MGMAADNLECYENLANAIILQAVKDYKTVLFRLEDHPNNRDAQFEKKRLEGFFHSNWYNTLTDLDAGYFYGRNTMSKKSNKVKFGLKNCHYAKATFDEDGSVTYAKPVRIPGAVSLSMDANGEIEPFYADNIAYYVVNNNSGYEGDLEIALIPESFLTDIMHEELDGNGVLAENANVELEHFAFLFEFDGDQRHIRHVLYNCVASRPSIEGETNEDSKEVKTDTLNLQATPLANGYVKAKTGTNTTDDVYNKWYDAVYEPQAEAVDTEDTSHTEEPQG